MNDQDGRNDLAERYLHFRQLTMLKTQKNVLSGTVLFPNSNADSIVLYITCNKTMLAKTLSLEVIKLVCQCDIN